METLSITYKMQDPDDTSKRAPRGRPVTLTDEQRLENSRANSRKSNTQIREKIRQYEEENISLREQLDEAKMEIEKLRSTKIVLIRNKNL